jgi:chromosome segregation ATPase
VLIERAEEDIERHKNRLNILNEKIAEKRERIRQLAERQASLPESKAEELNITIDRYRRQIKSFEAGVSAEKSAIRALRKEIGNHKKLLETYRRRELKRRSEGNRLQNLAERYSDGE